MKDQRKIDIEWIRKGFQVVHKSLAAIQKTVLRLADEVLELKARVKAFEKKA